MRPFESSRTPPPASSSLRRALPLVVLLSFLAVTATAQNAPPPASAPAGGAAIPAGISDFNIEVFAAFAYTWMLPDRPSDPDVRGHVHVIECTGEFELRMGAYELRSDDAVIWFTRRFWRDRPYYSLDVFLYRNAQVRQPGGTVETGNALLVSLRSFGRLVLNADAQADASDADSELYVAASRVRAGVGPVATQPAEESPAPVDVSPPGLTVARRPPKPPSPVVYRSKQLTSEVRDGRRIVVAIGDVYVSQGAPEMADFLELRADAAVLYLPESAVQETLPGAIEPDRAPREKPPPDEAPRTPAEERLSEKPPGREAAKGFVESIYLEGDVRLTRGSRAIRASRLYYDLQTDRALILDAVLRALEPKTSLPIYLRAAEVRQLSINEYRASSPNISASEFHTPHVSLGAKEATLTDRTPRNDRGDVVGITAGTYTARDTTLNLEGLPILYWPYAEGDFSTEQSAFRTAKFGYNNRFGAEIETRWHLFNLLGLEKPAGTDATLRLDEFTRRGPGAGIDADYVREDSFGLFRGYFIHDDGTDKLGGHPDRGGEPDTENRGRALWRHRQFLPQDWELTLEGSYISDRHYLEEYSRKEFENAKDQESVISLLKRQDNWQFSTLFNESLNDFVPLTKHYPDARFDLIGQPLGDALTLYSDSRAGVARYNPGSRDWQFSPAYFPPTLIRGVSDFVNHPFRLAEGRQRGSGSVFRGDTREEVTVPTPELGPFKLTPFGAIRGSAWDDSPEEGGLARVFGTYGVRGNMYLQRVYEEVESRLLDLHRLRHIIKPEFTLWNAHTNVDSHELFPLDPDVESIDDIAGAAMGVRQRWQTQRGEPGRWRTVDWITFDVQATFFSRSRPQDNTHGNFIYSRPEDSISSNFLSSNLIYRISDTTSVVYDGVYDWNGGNIGTSNVSLAYERDPRASGFLGWRYIHKTHNNLLALGGAYRLSEKYTIGLREYYDIDLNKNGETQIVIVRKWPRWYTAIDVEFDRTIGDYSVNFSIWPEGVPDWVVGSRRYAALGETIGLFP